MLVVCRVFEPSENSCFWSQSPTAIVSQTLSGQLLIHLWEAVQLLQQQWTLVSKPGKGEARM